MNPACSTSHRRFQIAGRCSICCTAQEQVYWQLHGQTHIQQAFTFPLWIRLCWHKPHNFCTSAMQGHLCCRLLSSSRTKLAFCCLIIMACATSLCREYFLKRLAFILSVTANLAALRDFFHSQMQMRKHRDRIPSTIHTGLLSVQRSALAHCSPVLTAVCGGGRLRT